MFAIRWTGFEPIQRSGVMRPSEFKDVSNLHNKREIRQLWEVAIAYLNTSKILPSSISAKHYTSLQIAKKYGSEKVQKEFSILNMVFAHLASAGIRIRPTDETLENAEESISSCLKKTAHVEVSG